MVISMVLNRNQKRTPYKYLSVYDDGLITEYVQDHWTERTKEHGPFAVFDNIENARLFIERPHRDNDPDVYYFNCEYEESVEVDLYCFRNRGIKTLVNIKLPKGTQLADKVKITTPLH